MPNFAPHTPFSKLSHCLKMGSIEAALADLSLLEPEEKVKNYTAIADKHGVN